MKVVRATKHWQQLEGRAGGAGSPVRSPEALLSFWVFGVLTSATEFYVKWALEPPPDCEAWLLGFIDIIRICRLIQTVSIHLGIHCPITFLQKVIYLPFLSTESTIALRRYLRRSQVDSEASLVPGNRTQGVTGEGI